MPSAELVAAVDELELSTFNGLSFRHQAAHWDPLSGAGARSRGGRWNPRESFATLYLATERQTAVGEFRRMAERSGLAPQDFLPRRIYRYELRLVALVDLRPREARAAVGLSDADLAADDPAACQAIGEAAHYLGREGILAPSATGTGTVLAVFLDRLEADSSIEPLDYETWEAPPQ